MLEKEWNVLKPSGFANFYDGTEVNHFYGEWESKK